jgi:hypothetical protein
MHGMRHHQLHGVAEGSLTPFARVSSTPRAGTTAASPARPFSRHGGACLACGTLVQLMGWRSGAPVLVRTAIDCPECPGLWQSPSCPGSIRRAARVPRLELRQLERTRYPVHGCCRPSKPARESCVNTSKTSRNNGPEKTGDRAGDRDAMAGEVSAKGGVVAKKALRSRWECPTCRARKILRPYRTP